MRRGVTLAELILAIAICGVIILSAASLDYASRKFFFSSDRRARVANELSFILEHIQKYASRAHGDKENPGYNVTNTSSLTLRIDSPSNPTPQDYSDDENVAYQFFPNQHSLGFIRNGSLEILSWRVVNWTFLDRGGGEVEIRATGRFYPEPPGDVSQNPEISLRSSVFLGGHSF